LRSGLAGIQVCRLIDECAGQDDHVAAAEGRLITQVTGEVQIAVRRTADRAGVGK
jgi:hypothetical protein